MTKSFQHQSVLLPEVLEALAINKDGIYVDATLGRGGHTQAILKQLSAKGKLIAIDKDPQAIKIVSEKLQDPRILFFHDSFAQLEKIVKENNLQNKIDGILLDLGVSSPQLDDAQRGFSFLQDGPLDMRMDNSQGQSVADWLASAKETEIANVLFEYGEERFSRRIARAIVAERAEQAITTTGRLAAIVSQANPAWEKNKHPATRSFQALRIFINQELTELKSVLEQAIRVLAKNGRLAVISFHSLEDRIVKRFIRQHSQGEVLPREVPVKAKQLQPLLKAIGRGVKPTEDEIAHNPRSRSAILRIAEKLS
jgi:16S rRNA (cytosine1402-N4)-methyltransferase